MILSTKAHDDFGSCCVSTRRFMSSSPMFNSLQRLINTNVSMSFSW